MAVKLLTLLLDLLVYNKINTRKVCTVKLYTYLPHLFCHTIV